MKRPHICECHDAAAGSGSLSLHIKKLSAAYLRLVDAAEFDQDAMCALIDIERTVNELFEGMTAAETYENRFALCVFKELVTKFGPRRAVH